MNKDTKEKAKGRNGWHDVKWEESQSPEGCQDKAWLDGFARIKGQCPKDFVPYPLDNKIWKVICLNLCFRSMTPGASCDGVCL
jgi:hypothetical protein